MLGLPARRLAVLVVDQEPDVFETLAAFLGRLGDRVDGVRDGESAIRALTHASYHAVVLEASLGPGLSGLGVCRQLRARGNTIPIIMASSLTSEADAVTGLEAGADDYVRKPFGPTELRSRIRAVLRRTRHSDSDDDRTIRLDRIVIDRAAREVQLDGLPVSLTFSEYELLVTLASAPGRAFRRDELIGAICGGVVRRDTRSIDVHVRHLRAKLETEPGRAGLIHTVRGVGYRLGDGAQAGRGDYRQSRMARPSVWLTSALSSGASDAAVASPDLTRSVA
jgi:two-component system, OmpR family, response regulator RegX3